MANKILLSDIRTRDLVPVTSRYSDTQVIYYGDQHKTTFKTYKKKTFKDSNADRYMEITAGYEYRPDKVSQLAYGTVDFWWVVMEANNIDDIFEFKAGLTIKIPSTVFTL